MVYSSGNWMLVSNYSLTDEPGSYISHLAVVSDAQLSLLQPNRIFWTFICIDLTLYAMKLDKAVDVTIFAYRCTELNLASVCIPSTATWQKLDVATTHPLLLANFILLNCFTAAWLNICLYFLIRSFFPLKYLYILWSLSTDPVTTAELPHCVQIRWPGTARLVLLLNFEFPSVPC